MDQDHDKFLNRIAKTLYYGDTSSFDSVSLPLTELAAELYNEVKKDKSLERLQVEDVAEMNQNACVSTCSLVLAILYLEKIKASNPDYVEKVAPSELFLVSLIVASKYLHDDGEEDAVSNDEWAACAGIPVKKVNEIEKEFLNAINWEIYIAEHIFWSRLLKMERYLANQEGKRRGWYSYTDLNVLLTAHELLVFKRIIKLSAIYMACYTTTVASLIAAGLAAIRLKHLVLNYVLYVLTRQVPPPDFVEYSNSTLIETPENDLTDLKLMEDAAVELPHQNLYFQTRTNECDPSVLLRNSINYSCEINLYKNKRGIGWLTYHVRNSKAEIIRRNDIAV